MSDRDTHRDAEDKTLDALLTGADDDLQNALRATLDAESGLNAILTGRGTASSFGADARTGGMGGRAQGAEDEELTHASFLIEAAPEDMFGTDAMTAPPVIGTEDETESDDLDD